MIPPPEIYMKQVVYHVINFEMGDETCLKFEFLENLGTKPPEEAYYASSAYEVGGKRKKVRRWKTVTGWVRKDNANSYRSTRVAGHPPWAAVVLMRLSRRYTISEEVILIS